MRLQARMAELPLGLWPSCHGEVLWGREPAQELFPSGPLQGLGPRQAEGIFQMDQTLSRNRVPGREECSTGDWKVQMDSLTSPLGPLRSQGGLLEGLTQVKCSFPQVPGSAWPCPDPSECLRQAPPCPRGRARPGGSWCGLQVLRVWRVEWAGLGDWGEGV